MNQFKQYPNLRLPVLIELTIDLIESRAGENAPLKAAAKRRSTAGRPNAH
jgi:hypothetical protein